MNEKPNHSPENMAKTPKPRPPRRPISNDPTDWDDLRDYEEEWENYLDEVDRWVDEQLLIQQNRRDNA